MSDRNINIIIGVIVILSLVVSYLLMDFSPKKNNIELTDNNKEVDKIAIINEEIDKNISNVIGHFTVGLSNYDLHDKKINIEINVKKNKDSTLTIEQVLLNNKALDLKLNESIIDFEIGSIKENNNSVFLYLVTITGSQDGEGDVVILNNNGNILYQNQKAYLEVLDDEKYLVKEKYCNLLTSLVCKDNDISAVAFENITYKSINAQLVNIDYEELKIGDICYNQ